MKNIGSIPKRPKLRKYNCPQCGNDFISDLMHPKYCSKRCSNKRNLNEYHRRMTLERFLQLLLNCDSGRSNLSVEFLKEMLEKQEGKCAITGIPMTFIRGQGRVSNNISIDRISPKFRYIPENIQLVCAAVNYMKRSLEMNEFLYLCKKIADSHFQC